MICIFYSGFAFAFIGAFCLLFNPSSELGHVYVNLGLIQVVVLPSVVLHEFGHAIVGKIFGLTVLRIWLGRGRTFYQAHLLGFDTEFKIIPLGGFTFLGHKAIGKLRLRYFAAILAGPAVNVVIAAAVWRHVSLREMNLETTIQFALIVFLAQMVILIENLLPYQIRTALGTVSTDGFTLFKLITFSPMAGPSKTSKKLEP